MCRRRILRESPGRQGPAGQCRSLYGAHEGGPFSGRGCWPDRRGGGSQNPGPVTSTPAIDSITDETWRAPAAKYFKGEIIVAKDLMVL